jgi:hypothetical protein
MWGPTSDQSLASPDSGRWEDDLALPMERIYRNPELI